MKNARKIALLEWALGHLLDGTQEHEIVDNTGCTREEATLIYLQNLGKPREGE